MKARHIIMIMILILFATIMFSLREQKGVKTLACSVNNDFQGMDSKTYLDVKVKNNEIKDMDIKIDVVIPDEYKNNKQNIINSVASSGKMEVEETSEGMRLKSDINGEYFKSLGLSTKTSLSEFKDALELQGYSCK